MKGLPRADPVSAEPFRGKELVSHDPGLWKETVFQLPLNLCLPFAWRRVRKRTSRITPRFAFQEIRSYETSMQELKRDRDEDVELGRFFPSLPH